MRDVLRQRLKGIATADEKLNLTHEFLQILTLKVLFDRGMFEHVAFVGGAALRILFDLKRFSEDLDFRCINDRGYTFKTLIRKVVADLAKYGFLVQVEQKEEGSFHSAMIKFPELLQELGFTPRRQQMLSIKLEIDTAPPQGWQISVRPVTSTFVFAVTHFDLPSLYAIKLHACFFRKYTKGRDFYDLVWYLGKKVAPNFPLLNNAIAQTEGVDPGLHAGNLSAFLREKIATIDFSAVRHDVERFLEDKNELRLLDRRLLLSMV